MFNDSLYHHGTKGMRWGIRRYQNKDGTLTKAGQKRYNKELENNREEKNIVKNKNTTSGSKSAKSMTNEELISAINRLQLENRYDQLVAQTQTVSKGKQFVKGFIVDKVLVPSAAEIGKRVITDTAVSLGKNYVVNLFGKSKK